MISIHDQLEKEVVLEGPAKRIVSLVPSQTELLFDLGLDAEVVGITKFCIHPDTWFRSKNRVGGTKDFKLDKIRELSPDLILANKEENVKDLLETLQQEFPVYTSDIHTLPQAIEMIEQVALLTGKISQGKQLAMDIQSAFSELSVPEKHPRVLYLIWRNPWMAAGKDTFIHDMLERCGFRNACQDNRYPELDAKTLRSLHPEIIFLSSEPYPFKESHIGELQAILPDCRIQLVDGEYFSWYGSRLLHAPAYFRRLVENV